MPNSYPDSKVKPINQRSLNDMSSAFTTLAIALESVEKRLSTLESRLSILNTTLEESSLLHSNTLRLKSIISVLPYCLEISFTNEDAVSLAEEIADLVICSSFSTSLI